MDGLDGVEVGEGIVRWWEERGEEVEEREMVDTTDSDSVPHSDSHSDSFSFSNSASALSILTSFVFRSTLLGMFGSDEEHSSTVL